MRLHLEYNGFTHPRAELMGAPTQVLLEIIKYTITALQSYALLLNCIQNRMNRYCITASRFQF